MLMQYGTELAVCWAARCSVCAKSGQSHWIRSPLSLLGEIETPLADGFPSLSSRSIFDVN